MKKIHALTVAAALAVVSSPASAALVDWNFTGVVNDPLNFPITGANPFPADVDVGDTVSFTYRIDTAATCSTGCGTSRSTYNGAVESVSLTVRGQQYAYTPTTSSVSLSRADNAPPGGPDYYSGFSVSFSQWLPSPGCGSNPNCSEPKIEGNASATSVFPSPLTSPVNSTTLSLFVMPLLSEFHSDSFGFSGQGLTRNVEGFGGDLTGSQVAPVPLPAAAWLLLSGLGGIATFARRRKAVA